MKAVSGISGVESVSVEMKDQKMTLIGDIDTIDVVGKLRKLCNAEIISVGPAKEEKKPIPKAEPRKRDDDDKKKPNEEEMAALVNTYESYYNQTTQPNPYYHHRTVGESPSGSCGCVIL
ncbi:heavy metal-associated isoprenylated plant protein [Trifolium repens]|nr:heavy metal-associated isoprenylated plant protein [Trifolium repens]